MRRRCPRACRSGAPGCASMCLLDGPPSSPRSSDLRSIGVSMKPGGTALTVMPVGPVLERQRLGQAVDRGLGRHVWRHVRLPGMRAGRGDVDDPAPAGLDHVRQHRLHAVEDAVEVDVDDPLPVVEREVGEPLEAFQPRGVHQDGDRRRAARGRRSARRRPRRGR